MVPESDTPVDRHLTAIQGLLDVEDFAGIEILLGTLPDLIADIPEQGRADVLQSVRSFIDDLTSHAASRSREIGAKLNALKTGRAAASAYEASAKLPIAD